MLNSALNTLLVSMCHPRGASLIACVISKVICGFVSVKWLFIVLIYSPTGRQQPFPQNTTCSSLLCPLLQTRVTWEAFSFKNLQMSTKLPLGQGTSSLFSASSSVLSWGKKYLFHAWLNQITKGFPGTHSADAVPCLIASKLGILPCLGISKI